MKPLICKPHLFDYYDLALNCLKHLCYSIDPFISFNKLHISFKFLVYHISPLPHSRLLLSNGNEHNQSTVLGFGLISVIALTFS